MPAVAVLNQGVGLSRAIAADGKPYYVSPTRTAEDNTLRLQAAFDAAVELGGVPVTLYTPGIYALEYMDFPGTDDGSVSAGGFAFICAGSNKVRFRAAVSSYPCFMTNRGGPIRNARLQGFSVEGNSSNVGQMGACLMGEPSSGGDYTGGWWDSAFSDLRFSGFDGPQLVLKGGQESSAGSLPMQALSMDGIVALRPTTSPWPSMMVLGQTGQIECGTLQTDPASGAASEAAAGLYFGSHFARTRPTISAVDTSGDYLTTSTHFLFPYQPCRLIGDLTGVVSSPQLAKDATYYAKPIIKSAATTFHQNRVQLAATVGGAAIDITNGGTPANYSLVTLWTTAAPANDEVTFPFCHLMSSTDEFQLYGSNLPSGLSTGVTYSFIKTGPKTGKFATSKANARTRTAITISGGTPADWGIQVFPVSGTPYHPFSFTIRKHTSQLGPVGTVLGDCENIQIQPYYETLKRAFDVWGCLNLTVEKGRLASAAKDSNNGLLIFAQGSNTRVAVDEDTLRILGTTDVGRYAAVNGPAQIIVRNTRQQTVAFSATPSVSLRSGRIINFGALTGNVTSFTLTDNPIAGEEVTIHFVQDGTGGRTVALGSSFKGGSISSGTASQKCTVTAKYDGTHWMYTFSAWA